MNVSLKVTASIEGNVSTTKDFGNPQQPVLAKALLDLVTGTSPGQADTVFSGQRTLAASANENLDLNGSLQDVFGAAANFVKVVAIYFRAATANTNNLEIGGAATNGFFPMFGASTDKIKLPPGAGVLLMNDTGWSVTAATADLLKVANGGSGTPVTYDVFIIGRSA
jgi:hypothetical protein